MSKITQEELDGLRALCDAATPGPWRASELYPDGMLITKEGYEVRTDDYDVCTNVPQGGPIRREPDAAFIAAARDALPRLLDALTAAQEEIDRLRGVLGRLIPVAKQFSETTAIGSLARTRVENARRALLGSEARDE